MWKLAVFPKIKFVQNNQLIIFLKAEEFGYYSIILCSISTKNIFPFPLEQYSDDFTCKQGITYKIRLIYPQRPPRPSTRPVAICAKYPTVAFST